MRGVERNHTKTRRKTKQEKKRKTHVDQANFFALLGFERTWKELPKKTSPIIYNNTDGRGMRLELQKEKNQRKKENDLEEFSEI